MKDHNETNATSARWVSVALIPWILASAALAWMAFYAGQRELRRQISQDSIAADHVGATIRPTEKIKFEAVDGCIHVDKGGFDSGMILVYISNRCGSKKSSLKYTVKQFAADNTMVKMDWHYLSISGAGPESLDPGEVAEVRFEITPDNRATRVLIGFDGGNYWASPRAERNVMNERCHDCAFMPMSCWVTGKGKAAVEDGRFMSDRDAARMG